MKQIFKKIDRRVYVQSRQKGATLIVVLVILVVMTFLGLGAMNDNNIQIAMVRNSQLQTGVYVTALTEINAQIDTVLNGDIELITDMINDGIPNADEVDRNTVPARKLDEALGEDSDFYTGTVAMTEFNYKHPQPVSGSSIDSPVGKRFLALTSTITVDNTGTSSSQTQGISYVSAR